MLGADWWGRSREGRPGLRDSRRVWEGGMRVGQMQGSWGAEVLPDYVADTTYLDDPVARQEHARSVWAEKARAFLKRKAVTPAEGAERKQKVLRKKSHHMLVCLDHILKVATGVGLRRFQALPCMPPSHWPHLSICSDQGPDMLCSQFFLRYSGDLHLRVSFTPDLAHGWHRDVEAAQRQCGLLTFCRLFLTIFNLQHAPWESAVRGEVLRCSSLHYFQEQNPRACPLLARYTAQLVEELGVQEHLGSDDLVEVLWTRMSKLPHCHRKGSRVAMSRWGSWIHTAKEFDEAWHTMLIRLIHMGISTGIFTEGPFSCAASAAKRAASAPAPAVAELGKTPTACKTAMHQMVKSSIHSSVVLLSDPLSRRKCRVQVTMVEPTRAWYSEQSHLLRSADETREWTLRMLGGELHKPLEETLALLSQGTALNHMGFETCFAPETAKSLTLESLLVQEQRELAQLCGSFALHLVSARVKRLMWLSSSFESQFLLLCSPSPDRVAGALQRMRQLWEDFENASLVGDGFWSKLCERSQFKTMAVQQMVLLLRESNWTVTPAMKALAESRVRRLLTSKLSEDSFCFGRQKETAQANKTMAIKKLYGQLLERGLGTRLHRFREVPYEQAAVPRGEEGALSEEIFCPKVTEAYLPLRKITQPKHGTTNSWFSTSAELSNIVYVDTVLSRYGARKGWALVAREHGWCCLVRPVGLVCLKLKTGNPSWVLSLGDVAGEVALVWPTVATAREGAVSFAVDFSKQPVRLCILSHADWVALAVRWIPPVEQILRGWSKAEEVARQPQLLLVGEGEPQELLRLAAMRCFWDLPMHQVHWIAAQLEVALDAADGEAEKLFLLLQKILEGMEESAVLDMLAKRCETRDDQLADLLAMPAFEEFVHASDAAGFAEAQEQEEKRRPSGRAMPHRCRSS